MMIEVIKLYDWLFKDENYTPIKDKDKFINKSIFSFAKMLNDIRSMNKYKEISFIYSINPIVKTLVTLIIIIQLALSRNVIFIFAVLIVAIAICLFVNKKDIFKIYIISGVLPLFTVIMLLPSILMGNLNNSLIIVLKVAGTIISVNILSYTTKWHQLTKVLKLIFVPDIFIFVMDIAIKYIFVLGEFSLEMLYSLKLRSVGKNNNKRAFIIKLMGNLFLKSKEAGDEMYSAMECRGFVGEYSVYKNYSFKNQDALYIMLYAFITIINFIHL